MIDQCIPDNEWCAGRPAFGRSAHWLPINTHTDATFISHPFLVCIHLISLYNRIIGYTQRTDNAIINSREACT